VTTSERPTLLTRPVDAFAEHNPVVNALVGLTALADLVRLLGAEEAGVRVSSGGATPEDRFVDALLGLVALAEQISRLVPPGSPARPAQRSTPSEPARWLR
jgi:hypothetical protein